MWVSNPSEELWTGTEANIRQAQELADRINATEITAVEAAEVELTPPSLMEKQGNVAVVKIHGPLFTNAPAFAKALFGVSDYTDISNALVLAAKDPSVHSIMLDVDSPGGAVAGVHDVAQLVSRIDEQVKPVHALAGGMMASAAYWISSGARQITGGPLSAVGSIGVLQIHTEYSKQLEKEGITTTVLRAGRYKALGNPVEPLSDSARAEAQSRLDYTYGIFMGHVAEQRGLPYDLADAKMGQGRVFLGEQARGAGLIDSVGTFEQALAAAEKVGAEALDTRKSLIQNPKKQERATSMGKKAHLSDAEIAALAGVPAQDPEARAEEPAPEAQEQPAAQPAAEGQPAEAAAAEAPPAETQADQTAVVALLERQLKDAQDAVLAARVEHAKAADQLNDLQAQVSPLMAIARDTTQKLYIALGSAGEHVSSLDTKALLEEHAKVSETFKNRFKVGGVAAASAQAKDEKQTPPVSPIAAARIKAVRLASK
jgi:signal peptide peptidase SppA